MIPNNEIESTAEELGSGTRILIKYGKLYSDNPIEMIEDDIFKTIVLVAEQVSDQAGDQVTMQADQKKIILAFCQTAKTRKAIQDYLGIKNRDYFRKEILNPMINQGLLELTIPDRPKSPNQQYIAVNPVKDK